MAILVTGGAGFKGSLLCHSLLQLGAKVVCVDCLKWGAGPVMGLISHPNFEFIKGDVRDNALMDSVLKRVEVVINLAAIVGYPACDAAPEEAKQVNSEFVKNLTKKLSKSQLLIHASTGSVYGRLEEICTEESPTNPLSLYGVTKLHAETVVRDVGGVNLRFVTAFGVSPCMRFDVLPSHLMWKALTERYIVIYESQAKRAFVDVTDMVRAYIFAFKNYAEMSGKVYNVGDELLNVSKGHITETVASVIYQRERWKVKIFDETSIKDKDARDYEVSFKKINSLGFECKVSLVKGLHQTYVAAKAVMEDHSNPWRIT